MKASLLIANLLAGVTLASPAAAQLDAEFEALERKQKAKENAAARRVDKCFEILENSKYRYNFDGIPLYPTSDPNTVIRVQIQDPYMGKPRDCASATFKVGQPNTYRNGQVIYTDLFKYVKSDNCQIEVFKTCNDLVQYQRKRWDDGDQRLDKYSSTTEANLSGDARWSRVARRK